MFPLAVNDWKKRTALFVVLAWVLPGSITLFTVALLCEKLESGFTLNFNDPSECPVTRMNMLYYNLIWKEFVVMTLFVLNFISAHNSEQPELVKERESLLPWNVSKVNP